MSRIIFNETGFGYIVINGIKYEHDVIVTSDGKINKRRKDISKRYRNLYGHTPLSKEEVRLLLSYKPKVIVIATGQYGALPIMEDALELLRSSNIEVIIDKTPKLLDKLNEVFKRGKRVVALIHVTC